MTRRNQVTTWYRRPTSAVPYAGDILVVSAATYVPLILADLEARKTPALWESEADFAAGYDGLCALEVDLLMDAREDIIREIRAARGSIPAGAALDTTTHPVGTYPGVALADLVGTLSAGGRSAADILTSIEGILQAQGTGEQGQLDALLQIVALLSV